MITEVSIIIPCYNGASWLKPTTEHIEAALRVADIKRAEVIIVNDGSQDNTSEVAHSLKSEIPIYLIDQNNSGRFLARKTGVLRAKYERILFIDTRVFLNPDSLKFIVKQQKKHPERQVWNGHVYVAKKGNIIARFGDAITFIGWRKYFSQPRTCSFGLDDFDYYPKGTGCFLVPKQLLLEAMHEFEKQTFDIKSSSDDTHLIRLIAAQERIYLSPSFSCTYHARTNIRQFVKHSYNRGKFFVDGFLRPGNRFYYPLIGFLIMCIVAAISVIIMPKLVIVFFELGLVAWILELIVALGLGVVVKDALSLFVLSPVFAVFYGAGIWRAYVKKLAGTT